MTDNQFSYDSATDTAYIQIQKTTQAMEPELLETGDYEYTYDKLSGEVIGVAVDDVSQKGNIEIPEHKNDIKGEEQ